MPQQDGHGVYIVQCEIKRLNKVEPMRADTSDGMRKEPLDSGLDNPEKQSPYLNAGWLSKATFWFVNYLLDI